MGPVYGGGGASAGWEARAAGKALAGGLAGALLAAAGLWGGPGRAPGPRAIRGAGLPGALPFAAGLSCGAAAGAFAGLQEACRCVSGLPVPPFAAGLSSPWTRPSIPFVRRDSAPGRVPFAAGLGASSSPSPFHSRRDSVVRAGLQEACR